MRSVTEYEKQRQTAYLDILVHLEGATVAKEINKAYNNASVHVEDGLKRSLEASSYANVM